MAITALQNLENSASGSSILHRTSSSIKLLFSLCYIITVVSVPKYEFTMLIPFALYIVWAVSFCQVPFKLLVKRVLQSFPLIFFIGISNLWLDKNCLGVIGSFEVTGGIISFGVLILKAFLTVSAAVILSATTPVNMLAGGLRQLHLPCILILQLLLTWRYLELLVEEGECLKRAYLQRNPKARHIAIKDWPRLVGTLLLRTIDRSERIYNAMQCRLFHAGSIPASNTKVTGGEIVWLAVGVSSCVLMRKHNLCKLLGEVLS